MACIGRTPGCGTAGLWLPSGVILGAAGFAVLWTLLLLAAIGIAASPVTHGGSPAGALVPLEAAWVGGFMAVLTFFLILVIMVDYALDRCRHPGGSPACVAGVVTNVVPSFSSALDHLFPFTAMHDRVDIVAKSRFWNVIEGGGAHVFCTDHLPPARSEILRCYFYEQQICAIGIATVALSAWAGVVGIGLGIAAAVAIGCATIVLCLLAMIAAALIVAVLMLGMALFAGHYTRATNPATSPTSTTGVTLAVGHFISVRGDLRLRSHDDGANAFYWVDSANLHGNSHSPQPFSYCDIDVEPIPDACP